jgi:hypothetical protein
MPFLIILSGFSRLDITMPPFLVARFVSYFLNQNDSTGNTVSFVSLV